MDYAAIHKKAGENTKKIFEGVKDEDWKKDSNCPPWTVHDLANHIVSENLWVKPLIEGKTIEDVGFQFEGDMLGDDPVRSYENSIEEASESFSQSGAMEATVHLSYGDFPGRVYCSHRIVDLVIHGWDLAVSTGQDDNLPGELVQAVWTIIEPDLQQMQESGYFGKPVTIPEDADPQTKLLGALGRDRSKFK